MRTVQALLALLAVLVLVPAVSAQAPPEPAAVGKVVAIRGTVQVGRDGGWQKVRLEEPLYEGQNLKTGADSAVRVLFTPELPIEIGQDTEIAVGDLLLKARLEKVKTRVSAPVDDRKTPLQVTPLTGVRGTEASPEKAEELKREHFWNEEVAPAGSGN